MGLCPKPCQRRRLWTLPKGHCPFGNPVFLEIYFYETKLNHVFLQPYSHKLCAKPGKQSCNAAGYQQKRQIGDD